MWDRDFAGAEFMGQVVTTLGKALELALDAGACGCWLPLSKRRAADAVVADAAWGDLLTVVAMAVVGVLAVTRGLPPPRRA